MERNCVRCYEEESCPHHLMFDLIDVSTVQLAVLVSIWQFPFILLLWVWEHI